MKRRHFTIGSLGLVTGASAATAGVADLRANCEKAASYLAQCNGHAMLVYQGEELLFERYMNGHTADKPHVLASGTKSFSGALLCCAAEDGLLSFDEPVADTITEWREHPRKSRITLRQLLQLTGGLDAGEVMGVPTYAQALASEAKHEPGTRFEYGPVPYQVFGEVMRRKLLPSKEDALDYLQRRIFSPIGLRYGLWREDADQLPHLPSGAFMTAREWAKFGLLIRDGGRWQGKSIIPEARLRECFIGSKPAPSYGLTFWLGKSEGGPEDLVMAAGKGKQKLYIIPSLKLLAVQLADAKRYSEETFLRLLLKGEA
jgi:CubicO group peptidase (beta-lactamase class C family)